VADVSLRAPGRAQRHRLTSRLPPNNLRALNVYVDGTRVGGGTFGTPGINGCADGATLRLGADRAGGQAITASFDRAAIFTIALSTPDIARWQHPGTVSGQVPPVLALTVGQPASFGTFQPGVAATYTSSLAASVISTAGNAALSVSAPSPTAPGHLVNGGFVLPSPPQVAAGSGAFGPLDAGPLTLLTYDAPVSNSGVTINFKQPIAATDGLGMGSYTKTLAPIRAPRCPRPRARSRRRRSRCGR
jgi:hypothetical protein